MGDGVRKQPATVEIYGQAGPLLTCRGRGQQTTRLLKMLTARERPHTPVSHLRERQSDPTHTHTLKCSHSLTHSLSCTLITHAYTCTYKRTHAHTHKLHNAIKSAVDPCSSAVPASTFLRPSFLLGLILRQFPTSRAVYIYRPEDELQNMAILFTLCPSYFSCLTLNGTCDL